MESAPLRCGRVRQPRVVVAALLLAAALLVALLVVGAAGVKGSDPCAPDADGMLHLSPRAMYSFSQWSQMRNMTTGETQEVSANAVVSYDDTLLQRNVSMMMRLPN